MAQHRVRLHPDSDRVASTASLWSRERSDQVLSAGCSPASLRVLKLHSSVSHSAV